MKKNGCHHFLERKEGIKLESQSKKKIGGKHVVLAVEAMRFISDCKADSFRARRRVVAHWYGTGTYTVILRVTGQSALPERYHISVVRFQGLGKLL